MRDLPLDTAHLLGFAVGLLMYGWYFGLFLRVIEGLWARRKRSRVLVWTTISIFLITTLNLILCAVNEYDAWIKHRTDPGVTAYLGLENIVPIRWVSYYFIECAEIMADVLLIWRLYVIWHKNKKIIILPAVLLASDFAMGTTIWLMAIITGINRRASQFSQAFFVLSIVNSTCALLLNVYSTTLVISRLWWDSRRASTPQTRGLYKTVIVSLVESGAMFTVTLILYSLFILLEIDGLTAFSQYVFTMVIAIAPMLIVIHLHENFPAPRAHSAVDGEVVLQSSSNSGSGFRRHTKEKTYSGAKMVISPVESFRMKPFRSSRPQDDSQIRSSMSAREARAWQEIPVTVEALSTTVTEMRLRLEEDQDMEKGDFGREEDEGLSPPPTPKFLEDLDYFPRDERRDAQMAGARREAPSYFHQ